MFEDSKLLMRTLNEQIQYEHAKGMTTANIALKHNVPVESVKQIVGDNMTVLDLINLLVHMDPNSTVVFEHREAEEKRKPWQTTEPDFKQSVDGVVFRNGECVLISSKLSKKNNDNS